MLSQIEMKLVHDPSMSAFPLISAVKGVLSSCGKCGHKNVNVHSALRLAVTRYKGDPEFRAACSRLFPLPVMLGGVLVE